MSSSSLTLGARWIFPVEGHPIGDGSLTIERGRITWVGPSRERKPDLDLGNVVILPGFVNAHTHLELSSIEAVAGDSSSGSQDEIDWLRRVVAQRRSGSRAALEAAVAGNLDHCLRSGTTTVADTTTAGLSWSFVGKAPVRSIVFAELIGLQSSRSLLTWTEATDWIDAIGDERRLNPNAKAGLSPHAPYSTSGWLYHEAAASRLPLSTHLAEMPEELALLARGDGRLRHFLEDLGAWDDEWEPIGPRPLDYIRRGDLRQADWLIAHGTYLDPADFWQLRADWAAEGPRVAVAYCPRTHARFGHERHPYRALLEQGVVVCLGTDSLASTPTLSVLDELRFLHQRDDSLDGPLLLTMATLFGAWALRLEKITGSLTTGKSADLAVISLPDRDERDPYRLLLDSDLPVVATMFQGAFVNGSRTVASPPEEPRYERS